MKKTVVLAFVALTCTTLRADFTYSQTSQLTGGSLLNILRAGGPFTRSAREPVVTTNIVKGNRMATISKDQISVIDLDKETITNIDTDKKQFSVITFAQMKQAMEDAMARGRANAKQTKSGGAEVSTELKASVKATGQTKPINGLNAKETQVLIETVMTAENGQSGAMFTGMNLWLAEVPGYDEVRQFQIKMGQKMGYVFGSGMSGMAMAQPQALKGMAQMSEQLSKMDGTPVQQTMKMGPTADGVQGASAPQQQQSKGPNVGAAATGAAVSGALGRVGLGGFGRKKEEKQEAPAEGNQQAANLMEMTTELSSFSNAPADASKFEVPTGYKQVENPLARRR